MEAIRTDRLILRESKASDNVKLLPLLNDKSVYQFVNFIYNDNLEDVDDFLLFYSKLCDFKNDFCIILENVRTKNVVGIIIATSLPDDTITISYAIKKRMRGNGYIVEALKAFIKYIQTNLPNIKTIEFAIRTINIPSIKVMKKLNISLTETYNEYNYYRLSLKAKLPW